MRDIEPDPGEVEPKRMQLSRLLPFFQVDGDKRPAPPAAGAGPEAGNCDAGWMATGNKSANSREFDGLRQIVEMSETPASTMLPDAMDSLKWRINSLKSDLKDQEEVQLEAAIRRMRDSVDHFQGGN